MPIAKALEFRTAGASCCAVRLNLNWKRPLFYCLLPILIFMAFVGFPPPFAPVRPTKPSQEQSAPAQEEKDQA
jgi:hypothetical protein